MGVVQAKKLPPVIVDKNGNIINTIVEPDRDDVYYFFKPGSNFRVDMDYTASPVVGNGELKAIDWTVVFNGNGKSLSSTELQLKTNFTTVEGSGIDRIENVYLNGRLLNNTELQTNDMGNKFLINDSKHYAGTENSTKYTFTFRTNVNKKQSSYALDLVGYLKGKNEYGAARLIMKGYPEKEIAPSTPTRVGMNNRTTIMGEFIANDSMRWVVTDEVSSGDKGTLPLETRFKNSKDLENQELREINVANYGIDEATGKMVQKTGKTPINPVQAIDAGSNPGSGNKPGTIAVYEYKTSPKQAHNSKKYSLSGVGISQYEDMKLDIYWTNLTSFRDTIPSEDITIKEKGSSYTQVVNIPEGSSGETSVNKIIENVKVWDIDNSGNARKIENEIIQNFSNPPQGSNYKYVEGSKYFDASTGTYKIFNHITRVGRKTVSFTILKQDMDTKKPLSGATFTLLGSGNTNTSGITLVTGEDGKAVFSNIEEGSYTLVEKIAPKGYSLDTKTRTVNISENGVVSFSGDDEQISGTVYKNSSTQWKDYMNALHYVKRNANNTVDFYVMLKPDKSRGGSTDRNTRLNFDIEGVEIRDYKLYDVSKSQRDQVVSSMYEQNVDNLITNKTLQEAGYSAPGVATIEKRVVVEPATQKQGYQFKIPSSRLSNDWAFLLKVTGNIKANARNLVARYDWITDDANFNRFSKLQAKSKVPESSDKNSKEIVLSFANKKLETHDIEVTKINKDKNPIQGAEFELSTSDGRLISKQKTDVKGKINFGKLPQGTYKLQEISAPEGYLVSKVSFDVIVSDTGTITFKGKDGSGREVQPGSNFFIQEKEIKDVEIGKPEVIVNSKSMRLREASQGVKPGVMEAYNFESYIFNTNVTFKNVRKGQRFTIKFDDNLNLSRYSGIIPPIRDGRNQNIIANPIMNYNTNTLTYVFNTNASILNTDIVIKGIQTNIYTVRNNDERGRQYKIIINAGGENEVELPVTIKVDYGFTVTSFGSPGIKTIMMDQFKGNDGKYYVKSISYLNPKGTRGFANRNKLLFDWSETTDSSGWTPTGIVPFALRTVNVYQVSRPSPNTFPESMGVMPEQDPYNYRLLISEKNLGDRAITRSSNGATIKYDKNKSYSGKKTSSIQQKGKLEIEVPRMSYGEGYVIEQYYEITDLDRYFSTSRYSHISMELIGGDRLQTAYNTLPNKNHIYANQTEVEIPKFYTQTLEVVNDTYTPGQFTINKTDETTDNALKNAEFTLTNEKGKVIKRLSMENGKIIFDNLRPGRYNLEESKAPQGFIASNKIWNIEVDTSGNLSITEIEPGSVPKVYQGNNIEIKVPNRKSGTAFKLVKLGEDDKPLAGAQFSLTEINSEGTPVGTKPDGSYGLGFITDSKEDGKIIFNDVPAGIYELKELHAPKGYQKLDKKWIVIIDENLKAKIYEKNINPSSQGIVEDEARLLSQPNTYRIDVARRPQNGWNFYDQRRYGYANSSAEPYKIGTRIIGINKQQKYVVQRYVINPEAENLEEIKLSIHREKPHYQNMDWYSGTGNINKNDIQIYSINKPITEPLIEKIRLKNLEKQNITKSSTVSARRVQHSGEPDRLEITLPKANHPYIVDVKVPYNAENGGIGTGADMIVGGYSYWKSDFYEAVSDIVLGEKTSAGQTEILGKYLGEGTITIKNLKQRTSFEIKKVEKENPNNLIQGAIFSLTNNSTQLKTTTATDENGKLRFNDLLPGEYTLEEEIAPPGYEKLNVNWTVTVAEDLSISMVENQKGTTINPSAEKSFTLEGSIATITNTKVGIDLVINKKNENGRLLQGAKFELARKEQGQLVDKKEVISNEQGKIIFEKLKVGEYELREIEAPQGYIKSNNVWAIKVVEENGKLVIKQKGATITKNQFLDSELASGPTIKSTDAGNTNKINFSSRLIDIDTEKKTYKLRLFVNPEGLNNNDEYALDFDINSPEIPRRAGDRKIYRTIYSIDNPITEKGKKLNYIDVSRTDIDLLNTARFRSTDAKNFGFTQDIFNINNSVNGKATGYIVDIEGNFDDTGFVNAAKKEIDIDVWFGKRHEGMENKLRHKYINHDKDPNTAQYYVIPFKKADNTEQKYKIKIDISSLYGASDYSQIPHEGLDIINEERTYNMTLTKFEEGGDNKFIGRRDERNRLEGAIFKLQKLMGVNYVDVQGGTLATAFNGYIGFNRLTPGTYRVLEVEPPKIKNESLKVNGEYLKYRRIEGPVLTFTLEHDGTSQGKFKIIQSNDLNFLSFVEKGQSLDRNPNQGGGTAGNSSKDKPIEEIQKEIPDFVTTATKHLGKITNYKPGSGKILIKKVDENGAVLQGVKFKLIKLDQKDETKSVVFEEKITNAEGKAEFIDLPIGKYLVQEVEGPTGYVLNKVPYRVSIGGKSIDPYDSIPERIGTDLTTKLNYIEQKFALSKDPGKYLRDNIKPEINNHQAESMIFESKIKFDANTKIQPGDYFIVKLKGPINIYGVANPRNVNLDIVSTGIGTLAKGDYISSRNEIKYTFTNYVRDYEISEITQILNAYIDPYLAKEEGDYNVGLEIKESKTRTIRAVYDKKVYTGHTLYYGTTPNMKSRVTELDEIEGTFVEYAYLNPNRLYNDMSRFEFKPNAVLAKDPVFTVYEVLDRSRIPTSYGIDFNDQHALRKVTNIQMSKENAEKGNKYSLHFNDLFRPEYQGWSNRAYIVKIEGKLADSEKVDSKFTGFNPENYMYSWNYYYPKNVSYAMTNHYATFTNNSSQTDAIVNLNIVNPKNEIEFIKISPSGEKLQGVQFELRKNNQVVDTKTSDAEGKIKFEKLAPGNYKLFETVALDGYVKPKDAVASFTVNLSGEIENITPESKNIVNSKEIKFIKVDEEDKKPLNGAEFELYYKSDKKANYEVVYKEGSTTKTEKFVSVKGEIKIPISKPGYYALKETKAPLGYVKPNGFVKEFLFLNGEFKEKIDDAAKEFELLNIDKTNKTVEFNIGLNSKHDMNKYVKSDTSFIESRLQLTSNNFKINSLSIYRVPKSKPNSEAILVNELSLNGDFNTRNIIDLYNNFKQNESGEPVLSDDRILLRIRGQYNQENTFIKLETMLLLYRINQDSSPKREVNNQTIDINKASITEDADYRLIDKNITPMINNKKIVYPSTGGKGIKLFIYLGLSLMAIAFLDINRKNKKKIVYRE